MKDREEFLASVYAKRDAELAKRRKYKKRVVSGLSAAAACLVLTVGLVQMDVLNLLGAATEGAVGSDSAGGAVMESINEAFIPYEGETETADDTQAVEDLTTEDGYREDGSGADGTVEPGSAPSSAPEVSEQDTAAAAKDIYDLEPDTDTDGSDTAYYCLPCFTIEVYGEEYASATHGVGLEDVEKVKAWVEGLAENGQLLPADPGGQEEVTCIVTIEEEPQQKDIYYLTGEVGWYE